MSRGLGKWERFILDKLTHYCDHTGEILNSETITYLANYYFNFRRKDNCPECSDGGIFSNTSYHYMNPEEKSVYQAISRAARSLENKGIVTKRLMPDGCDPENDKKIVWEKWIDLIDFKNNNNKCLIRKYHYLSKCLTKLSKLNKAKRLLINGGMDD